jgi:hypothetical protein
MIASVIPLSASFVLTDPDDPRYHYVMHIRRRFGHFLHDASVSLRRQGEESTVDAVQVLVWLTMVFNLSQCIHSFSRLGQLERTWWNTETVKIGNSHYWSNIPTYLILLHFQLLRPQWPVHSRKERRAPVCGAEGLAQIGLCPTS